MQTHPDAGQSLERSGARAFGPLGELVLKICPITRGTGKRLFVEGTVLTAASANALQQQPPTESLYGICADLGPAPSAEDIDEVRREMWSF